MDRGKHIHLEAQIAALNSVVAELAVKCGTDKGRVEACLRERLLIFQDQLLLKYENFDSELAARIDNRPQSEIPDHKEFRPLFPEV
jgi:uncharacterized protein YheU (UPF0270 family)